MSPPPSLTDSRLAALCAEEARKALDDYEARFDAITRRARDRFLARDWHGSYQDAAERLRLYSLVLDGLTNRVKALMGPRLQAHAVWSATKAVYSSLIAQSIRWEIAESFFNSLTRRVFATDGVDQAIEFVDTDFDAPPSAHGDELAQVYSGAPLAFLLREALTDAKGAGFPLNRWSDLNQASRAAADRILAAAASRDFDRLEILRHVFYRGRGAYLVGRIIVRGEAMPLGLVPAASRRGRSHARCGFDRRKAIWRFSFPTPAPTSGSTRPRPTAWCNGCARSCRAREWPIFTMRSATIGMPRQSSIAISSGISSSSRDHFVAAEGARGMVMLVFTLPSYDVVFKLIRDQFDAPKESDRRDVMRRYRLVFEHDRAGRLVEAHEFEHLRIARDRFEPSLLQDLLGGAASTVRIEGDDVLIAQAYVERRVRPLNLLFRECDEATAIAAACDYAQSIKDLAASNIFAGDLLTKNFGLTRRGRVVFYDYDELCLLTDCNFRTLPQSRSYEEEMAAEPWFSVREGDIFPEEFPNFLSFPEPARTVLMERHGDLFRPEYWRGVQEELRAGHLPEILPYRNERRLHVPKS